MKHQLLICSSFAALALAACDKEESGTTAPENGREKSVIVTIRTNDTKALQDAFSTTHAAELTSGTIFFTAGAGDEAAIVQTAELDPKSTSQVIHNVHPNATHALLVANYEVEDNPQTVKDLYDTQVAFDATYQTLKAVPLRSEIGELTEGSFTDETHSEGNQYKVTLNVKPILARIEIGGNLKVTKEEEEVFDYQKLTPDVIGLNNLHTAFTLKGETSGSLYAADDNSEGYPATTPATPTWMYDKFSSPVDLIGAADNTMAMGVHGFNVAPGSEPVITIALQGTPTEEADPKPAYPRAYLKIVNFSEGTETIEAGNIYKIENVAFKSSQAVALDNTVVCVEVTVSVSPWTVKEISPEFGDK